METFQPLGVGQYQSSIGAVMEGVLRKWLVASG